MLLILGLDGATLDLAAPWAADGTLPHLASLMREGAWGRLASTVPPATFPGWTSFMTGVNPGRHGIFDFTRRDGGAYRVRFVNATHRRAASVWRLMSDAGRRVCVLGLPGTYPPEPVNGCMVSGFDTPVTTRADASFVYPNDLAPEVERLGGFPFADFQEFDIGPGWHERALASLLDGISKKTKLAEAMLERERWDCLMLLLGESDTVAHHFWAFHDPRSPRFDRAGARRLGDPVRTVYQALDGLVGKLRRRVPGATILVVSDHGFGGAGDTAIHLNRWLAEQGWLRWARSNPARGLAARLRRTAVRVIPERWQARCFRLAGGLLASRVESAVRFGGIDWSSTRAFSEELNYFPSIWLNVEGREEHGTLAARDYDGFCEEVRSALLAWRDPLRGTPVVRRVWRRAELYHGPCVGDAPDLVLDLETPDGYSYLSVQSGGPGPTVEVLPLGAPSGKLRGMSGSHRPDGLFALAGPAVGAGEVMGARIVDMAPTILSILDLPVPADWDGRPLRCLKQPGSRAAFARPTPPSAVDYDAAEEESLVRRLTQLGYFE
jgi:predicted AlkP superfamily phosphohydrolase/phosphomutase